MATTVATGVGRPPRSDAFNQLMITLSIMTATIMNSLDTTIANVALPHIQGSVSASQDQITWVLTSYIVSAAIMTPVTGWLAARFGRKIVFLFSIGGFTVASALCGIAGSLAEIVIFRLLQGLCGAALVPLSQSVMLDTTAPEKRGQAMAVWGMGAMLGPIMGPALGGWLTDNYSWRWVFYINVPFGVAAALGVFFFIHGRREENIPRFDFIGFLALAIGIASLQLMLDRGQIVDWFSSPEIWLEATLAGLGLWWTVVNTATAAQPFVRRRLLKDRNFVAACVFGFFIGVLLFSTLALLPPMLEELFNYPVVTTGLVTAPRGVGTLFSMFIVGRLIGRVDTRLILLAGLLISAYALHRMTAFELQMGTQPIVVSGLLQGVGLGLLFVPLSTLAFSTLAPELRTEGAGIYTLIRNIGSSVGISIVEAMQTQNVAKVHSHLVGFLTPDNPSLAGSGFDLDSLRGLAASNAAVNVQSAMISYLDSFKFIEILAFVAMPLVLFMRTPKNAAPPDPEHMAME